MDAQITVVTPAFRADRHIGEAVRSVIAQTFAAWRMIVVSDDGLDYGRLLSDLGLRDPRLRFLTTGRVGAGASRARNLALEAVDTPYVAVLDADDRFKPGKLERVVAALAEVPIVSSALDVMDEGYRRLRTVAAGPDGVISPGRHKFVSFSMDSMIAWDRRRCDARYDLELTNMTDLELLMQLYRTASRSFHIGTPVHDYLKVSSSMSNGPGFTERMVRSKRELLARLGAGRYPMADPSGPEGIARFLEISLTAEESYPSALAANPSLLFEDHIEPLLAASSAA